jgi:hypothetical protein
VSRRRMVMTEWYRNMDTDHHRWRRGQKYRVIGGLGITMKKLQDNREDVEIPPGAIVEYRGCKHGKKREFWWYNSCNTSTGITVVEMQGTPGFLPPELQLIV